MISYIFLCVPGSWLIHLTHLSAAHLLSVIYMRLCQSLNIRTKDNIFLATLIYLHHKCLYLFLTNRNGNSSFTSQFPYYFHLLFHYEALFLLYIRKWKWKRIDLFSVYSFKKQWLSYFPTCAEYEPRDFRHTS